MKNIGHGFVQFDCYFWGINEQGEKVEFSYTVQTAPYARMLRDQAMHYYNEMVWGEFKGVMPMHIEIDGTVFYHVGKRNGGTGKKVCRI